jgi:hypothetical protein
VDDKAGLSGVNLVLVVEENLGNRATVDPRAVGAVQVADSARLVTAFDSEMDGRHFGVVREGEVGPLGPSNLHGISAAHHEFASAVRAGNDLQHDSHDVVARQR